MKTAVIISGHMRSFARCLPTIAWHVLRHYPDVDFYVSTVNDRDAKTAELLRERFPKSRVEIEYIESQPEIPIPVQPTDPKWLPNQNRIFTHEPYALSVHPQAVLRQLWHLNRAWSFFVEKESPAAYGCLIRLRPDSYFKSFKAPAHIGSVCAHTPWWGRFGGCNDRFAIMDSLGAGAYFTTFSRLSSLLAAGCPLHPESLIHASLWEAGIDHNQHLKAIFAKLVWTHGEGHGSFRQPEILDIDLADVANPL